MVNNDDALGILVNLVKARQVWDGVGRVLCEESTSLRVCAKFYAAVVQSVLLYSNKMWAQIGGWLW